MEIKYTVYRINGISVCTPSEDYYRRQNDWQDTEINELQFYDEFDSEEDAIAFMSNSKNKGTFTILKTYKS